MNTCEICGRPASEPYRVPPGGVKPPSPRARVLIADDTDAVLRLTEKILEESGFEVFVSSDGESAIEMAEALHPDVIVLDLLMPKMTGFDTLREIRRRDGIKDIPVLAMSAVYKENVIGILHQLGAAGFVDKEHLKESLVFRVRAALETVPAAAPLPTGAAWLCAECRERRSAPDPAGMEAPAAITPRGRPRILIADDAETTLLLAEKILTDAGYQVLISRDGESALELAEQELPDVVILDLLMPKMTGFEVLREIKKSERLKAIPVLVMSGVYKQNVVDTLHQLGAVGFLDKESLVENLVFRVRNILEAAPA